jgi:ribosomal protein L11 methylase PrmA
MGEPGEKGPAPIRLHIHLNARMQSRYKGADVQQQVQGKGIGLTQMKALLDSLESLVRRLHPPAPESGWSEYYTMQSYSEAGLADKQVIVEGFCEKANAYAVWDLGANTGLFSRIAAQKASTVLSIDSDHDAVELNYRQCRDHGEKNILPLWIDLTNPSGGGGWDNRERLSLKERGHPELVIALALVHHLAISNNVPLSMIADYMKSITTKWLIIEFVPKSDPKTQLLLRSREDIFPGYTKKGFEDAFSRCFKIVEAGNPADSERTVYLMKAAG